MTRAIVRVLAVAAVGALIGAALALATGTHSALVAGVVAFCVTGFLMRRAGR